MHNSTQVFPRFLKRNTRKQIIEKVNSTRLDWRVKTNKRQNLNSKTLDLCAKANKENLCLIGWKETTRSKESISVKHERNNFKNKTH